MLFIFQHDIRSDINGSLRQLFSCIGIYNSNNCLHFIKHAVPLSNNDIQIWKDWAMAGDTQNMVLISYNWV